jgi:hypothetical protein
MSSKPPEDDVAGAQSAEAKLRRYLESHNTHLLDSAIEQLEREIESLPNLDATNVGQMLNLAGALALRFTDRNDRTAFRNAIFALTARSGSSHHRTD